MSTEMLTRSEAYYITRFWGGDARGRCIQVTASAHPYPYFSLTRGECLAESVESLVKLLETDLNIDDTVAVIYAIMDIRDFGNDTLEEDE